MADQVEVPANIDQLKLRLAKLYAEYHKVPFSTRDFKWRQNWISRVRRIAAKLNPKAAPDNELYKHCILYIDVLETRSNIQLWSRNK